MTTSTPQHKFDSVEIFHQRRPALPSQRPSTSQTVSREPSSSPLSSPRSSPQRSPKRPRKQAVKAIEKKKTRGPTAVSDESEEDDPFPVVEKKLKIGKDTGKSGVKGKGKEKLSPKKGKKSMNAGGIVKKSLAPKSTPKGKEKGTATKGKPLSATTSSNSLKPASSLSSLFATSSQPVSSMSLLALSQSSIESEDSIKANWNLASMDEIIWVKSDSLGGWWPGLIKSSPRSTRPLVVDLLLDSKNVILKHSSRSIELSDPTHLTTLSFLDSSSNPRFDHANFLSSSPSTELVEAFKEVAAKGHDKLFDDSDVEDSGDDLDMLSQSGGGRKRALQEESSESEEDVKGMESDDELLKSDDEDAHNYPVSCLASTRARKNTWWPARIESFDKAAKKYKVTYCDLSCGFIQRTQWLTPRQPEFFSVTVGDVVAAVPKNYDKHVISVLADSKSLLTRIIQNKFNPSRSWNEAFFAGGAKRDDLAKKARFGEWSEKVQDAVSGWLSEWVEGVREGCEEYEGLRDGLKVRYVSDVLLPLSVILVTVEEEDFFCQAKLLLEKDFEARQAQAKVEESTPDPELVKALEEGPSDDEVEEKAFELASGHLDLAGINKHIRSVIAARKVAQADEKGMEDMKRKMELGRS